MSTADTVASDILQASAAGYAGYAVSELMARQPGLAEAVPSESFRSWKAHLTQRIIELAAALRMGSVEMFTARVRWTQRTFQARGMPQDALRASLEALQQVLGEHLPPDASESACRIIGQALATWDTDLADGAPAALDPRRPTDREALIYLQDMLDGDIAEGTGKLLLKQDAGRSITDLYCRVLLPALREVGRLWHAGDITIAEEHLVTAATGRAMTILAHRAERSQPTGKTMIAACVKGNAHDLGLRAATDLFDIAGWRALYLGSDVPMRELPATLVYFDADLLLLSATLSTQVPAVERTIEQVRRHCERSVHIMVGGAAFDEVENLWAAVGADSYACSVDASVRLGEQILKIRLN